MIINKENTSRILKKTNQSRQDLEVSMIHLTRLIQKLWKITLKSKLYAKDKAEILRMLILALIVIVQTGLFVWLFALILSISK